MPEITLAEIRSKKSVLESGIDKLIDEFFKETGVWPVEVVYQGPSTFKSLSSGAEQTIKTEVNAIRIVLQV